MKFRSKFQKYLVSEREDRQTPIEVYAQNPGEAAHVAGRLWSPVIVSGLEEHHWNIQIEHVSSGCYEQGRLKRWEERGLRYTYEEGKEFGPWGTDR